MVVPLEPEPRVGKLDKGPRFGPPAEGIDRGFATFLERRRIQRGYPPSPPTRAALAEEGYKPDSPERPLTASTHAPSEAHRPASTALTVSSTRPPSAIRSLPTFGNDMEGDLV